MIKRIIKLSLLLVMNSLATNFDINEFFNKTLPQKGSWEVLDDICKENYSNYQDLNKNDSLENMFNFDFETEQENANECDFANFDFEQDSNINKVETKDLNSKLNTIIENLDNLEPELGIAKNSFEFKFLTLNSVVNKKSKKRKRTQNHTSSPLKRHQCDQCDYTTKHKSHLKTHKLTHTGEKPYKCDQCDKAFTEKTA